MKDNKTLKVLNWIFSVFCILCLPVFGFHIGSILMCALGIVSLPVDAVRDVWENLPAYKVLRPLIIGILFVVFACMIPTSSTYTNDYNIADNSTETLKDVAESEISEALEDTEETDKIETAIATEESLKLESDQTEAEEVVTETEENVITKTQPSTEITLSVEEIPEYSGNPYVTINNNIPQFLETDLSTTSYEYYSELDNLGRCGVAYACIGTDLMPTEERGNIGSVKPSGWHTVKYEVVDGNYLYNRCHLIGYQLSGENANTKNLITGTRYMNTEGMLPFENMVCDYVQETENHVMYRVTPIFDEDNLLASGVQIEAQSVEDDGDGIFFNVFCYNVQPEVAIDYVTGDSQLIEGTSNENTSNVSNETVNAENSVATNETSVSDNSNSASDNTASSSNDSASIGSGGSSSVMVWKSATGSKYHSINNCGNMNPNKATQITEEQAINQGLGKCSKCW